MNALMIRDQSLDINPEHLICIPHARESIGLLV